jgi:hypothetical protein
VALVAYLLLWFGASIITVMISMSLCVFEWCPRNVSVIDIAVMLNLPMLIPLSVLVCAALTARRLAIARSDEIRAGRPNEAEAQHEAGDA